MSGARHTTRTVYDISFTERLGEDTADRLRATADVLDALRRLFCTDAMVADVMETIGADVDRHELAVY